jgi:hypothetical protein
MEPLLCRNSTHGKIRAIAHRPPSANGTAPFALPCRQLRQPPQSLPPNPKQKLLPKPGHKKTSATKRAGETALFHRGTALDAGAWHRWLAHAATCHAVPNRRAIPTCQYPLPTRCAIPKRSPLCCSQEHRGWGEGEGSAPLLRGVSRKNRASCLR